MSCKVVPKKVHPFGPEYAMTHTISAFEKNPLLGKEPQRREKISPSVWLVLKLPPGNCSQQAGPVYSKIHHEWMALLPVIKSSDGSGSIRNPHQPMWSLKTYTQILGYIQKGWLWHCLGIPNSAELCEEAFMAQSNAHRGKHFKKHKVIETNTLKLQEFLRAVWCWCSQWQI